MLAHGHPLVLAGDGDVGGLIGIHYCEEMKFNNPIVSIDGLELKEFDYIDIGAILDTSGAVPVVIKSLIFPTKRRPSARIGRPKRAVAPAAATTWRPESSHCTFRVRCTNRRGDLRRKAGSDDAL